jgi:hypothetical protein
MREMTMFVSRRYLPLMDIDFLAPVVDGLRHAAYFVGGNEALKAEEALPLYPFGRERSTATS